MCGTNIFCLQVISKSVRLFPPGAEDPGTNFFLFNNMFYRRLGHFHLGNIMNYVAMNTHGRVLCGRMFSLPLSVYVEVESTFSSKEKKNLPQVKLCVAWSAF